MLLDTSGLYCYLDSRDKRQRDADSMLKSAELLLTHNYVLAELVSLSDARGFDRGKTLDFVGKLADSRNTTVVWIDPVDHRLALDLLRSRPDKNYSLCDAVSFLLMRRHHVTEALTTDRHFDQEGFVRLLPY